MMSENKKEELIKALESTESFFALLDNERREEEYSRLKQAAKTEIHPSGSMLYDLFNGSLDEDKADNIQNHLLYCRRCSDEFARIMRIENELDAEAMEWIGDTESEFIPSLLELIRNILVTNTVGLKSLGLTHRGVKKDDTYTDDYQVISSISHTARYEGEYVVLLEESDDNSENIMELIQLIRKADKGGVPKHLFQTAVLGIKDEKWKRIKILKGMNLPLKIKAEDTLYNEFVLVMGASSKVDKNVKIIINALNGKKSEKDPKDIITVVITEIKGGDKQ